MKRWWWALTVALAAITVLSATWLATGRTPKQLARAAVTRAVYYTDHRPLSPRRLGNGKPATRLRLYAPMGIARGPDGHLYLSDRGRDQRGRVIWRIDERGIAHIVAGTGRRGTPLPGQAALEADLAQPEGIAFGPEGRLHFVDAHSHRVFRIGTDGLLFVVAGTGTPGYGGDGGAAPEAQLQFPADIRFDASGNLYIADVYNHRIRRVDPAGTISTVVGTGTRGFSGDGGPAEEAHLDHPWGLLVDPATGDLLVADSDNHRVRRVGRDGIIHTVAGSGVQGYSGDGGPAAGARFDSPQSLAVDCEGAIYVGDEHNHVVRRIDPGGRIETVLGIGEAGQASDGAMARSAPLNDPENLIVECDRSLFVTESDNGRVLKVTPEGRVEIAAGRAAEGPSFLGRVLSEGSGGRAGPR